MINDKQEFRTITSVAGNLHTVLNSLIEEPTIIKIHVVNIRTELNRSTGTLYEIALIEVLKYGSSE